MARDIKYRGWYGGKMIEVGSIQFFDGGRIVINDELVGVVLMEFTGLYDKRSKEIYEGDIVDTYPYYKFQVKKNKRFQKIVFKDGAFMAEHSFFGWEGEGLVCLSECTVIGNIYENPDLIKQPPSTTNE